VWSWSPAELNRIAYVDAEGDIWIAGADGRSPERLLKGNFTLPAWSEDGRVLAIAEKKGDGGPCNLPPGFRHDPLGAPSPPSSSQPEAFSMKKMRLVRAGAVLVCLVFAGGWAAGCSAMRAPAATPEPPKHPGVIPPGRTTPPVAVPHTGGQTGRVQPIQPPNPQQIPLDALVAAAAPNPPAPARQPAPDPLTGPVTRTALENYETWTTLRAQDYTPDPAAVRTIAERGKDVRVLVIVATWCPDSRREVPRFFKIYDQAGIDTGRVTMIGVDRSEKDAEGLTVKYGILRVPTFVFFRGEKEIGRVERAVTTLEQDIATILTK
jgi:thiol-disulfide isomerase/thioredoxin